MKVNIIHCKFEKNSIKCITADTKTEEFTMNTTAKRRKFIIDIAYFIIIIGLFYLFFKYALGIFVPFLSAVFVAMLLQKPVDFLSKKLHGGRGIISAVLVLFCFLIVGSVLVLALMKIFSEMKEFFNYLMIKINDAPVFIEQIKGFIENRITILPENIRLTLSTYVEEILSKVLGTNPTGAQMPSFDLSLLASPIGMVWGTAKQIPMIAVGIIVSIVSCCFLTADYSTFRNLVLTLVGENNSVKLVKTKSILISTLGKIIKAYCILMIVTFTEMLIGLSFLKITGLYEGEYVFVIALITAIVDILPVLGTGTVLVPWGIWSLATGKIGFGIGILVVYAVITIIRQIIEPKLIAGQLGLPAFITITAMYIGTQLFGFLGLFLLPMSIMLLKVLNDEGIINVFRRQSVTPEMIEDDIKVENEAGKEND